MQALKAGKQAHEPQARKAGFVEPRGNVSFSQWHEVKDDATGEQILVPGRIQYVLDGLDKGNKRGVSPSEQYWLIIETPVSSAFYTVNVRKGRNSEQSFPVDVVGGKVDTKSKAPLWAAKIVEDEVLPWLSPLAESGYKAPVISRDEETRRINGVKLAGYSVYWSYSPIGGKLSFINVSKTRGKSGGAHVQLQYGVKDYQTHVTEDRRILYFPHEGREIGVKFGILSSKPQSAWARPELPLHSDNNGPYEPIEITPELAKTARERLQELDDAFGKADSARIKAALHDAGRRLAKTLKGKQEE
jgi:hypothetical protein